MLRFQQTPDKVFIEILMRSLDFVIDSIREELDRRNGTASAAGEYLASLLPLAMRVFSPEAAFVAFTDMRDKLQRPELYYLNDYHYLLLYDALELFSTIHNDAVDACETADEKRDAAMIGEYSIEKIDFDLLVELFFYDTDFLLDPEHLDAMTAEQKKCLDLNPETYSLTHGLAPHPEELVLKVIDDEPYEVPELSRYFGPDSVVYPDEAMLEDA